MVTVASGGVPLEIVGASIKDAVAVVVAYYSVVAVIAVQLTHATDIQRPRAMPQGVQILR